MTTANENITRTDTDAGPTSYGILTQFKSVITNAINAFTKTTTASAAGTGLGQNPFGANAPISGGQSSNNYGAVPLSAPVTPPNIVTTHPITGDIPAGNVSAATLVLLFQTTAQTLSRVRRYSMVKTYLSPAPVVQMNLSSVGRYAFLTPTYQLALAAFNPDTASIIAGSNISASSLDSVVTAINARLTTQQNTVVAFTETWCHTNCHSNHSARGRR